VGEFEIQDEEKNDQSDKTRNDDYPSFVRCVSIFHGDFPFDFFHRSRRRSRRDEFRKNIMDFLCVLFALRGDASCLTIYIEGISDFSKS